MNDIKIKVEGKKAYVYTPYNKSFTQKIKKIRSAIWNGSAWKIDADFVPAVREIIKDVYGYDDTDTEVDTVSLRVTFLQHQEKWHDDIRMFGKTVAAAYGRNTGAKLGKDAALIKGNVYSGGSVKNWTTNIAMDSVILLNNVPREMYEKRKDTYSPEEIKIEIAEDNKNSREKLKEEKERLLKRIAEIDKLLLACERNVEAHQ